MMKVILTTADDPYCPPLDIEKLTDAEAAYIVGLVNKKMKQFLPFTDMARLSHRLGNALLSAHIYTLHDIATRTKMEWHTTNRLGVTSYRELQHAVKPYGLTLADWSD